MTEHTLQQHRQRVFDQLLEGGEELRADRAVDDAMIAGERQVSRGARHAAPSLTTARCAPGPPPGSRPPAG